MLPMNEDIYIKEELKNDELLKLMHEMRTQNTPQKMLEVLQLAAASFFIVPVDRSADGRFSFHAVGDKNGRRFMAAYSDTGSFVTAEKDEDQKGVKASFEDLMEAVLDDRLKLDGVIINPGASEVIFGRELMNSIKGQMKPQPQGSDMDMTVVKPAEYPPKLKPMLNEFCKDNRSIRRVYAVLLSNPDQTLFRWLIGVDSSMEGDEEKYLLDTLAKFMTPYLQGIEPLAVSTDEDYVKQAIKDSEPFYERT